MVPHSKSCVAIRMESSDELTDASDDDETLRKTVVGRLDKKPCRWVRCIWRLLYKAFIAKSCDWPVVFWCMDKWACYKLKTIAQLQQIAMPTVSQILVSEKEGVNYLSTRARIFWHVISGIFLHLVHPDECFYAFTERHEDDDVEWLGADVFVFRKGDPFVTSEI